ncbi:MAG: hypothetical protein N4J56_007015 [Chroococcidiopsis sp. SAG 2025]|uniref:hypothetical protein n=1 Tax=Chroococcidiopsis sp. SAG 2025 TaxID=171389 RepID=UPI00293747AC|nr:hypothetical protein [Chroococcidiopsis sp. SAG 2025]MDV2997310.1 hypothetical protein [Chroococcidiopsis sp. SAG 2025]
MSKNTGKRHLKNLPLSAQHSVNQNHILIQKYLQNPFSISWSKLVALFKGAQTLNCSEAIETDRSQQFEPDSQQHKTSSIRQQDLYPHFADRIDPSLYYSIFYSAPYW